MAFFHSFIQEYLVHIYYVLGILLSETQQDSIDRNPCTYTIYILVGKVNNKYIKNFCNMLDMTNTMEK